MLKNVGPEDRIMRIVIGIGLAVLIFVGAVQGTAAIIVGLLAAVLIATGLLARCPAYKLANIDTSVQEQSYSTTDDRSGL
ncbi:DUF2892 domain-containing protein [Sphingomonas sabuli]|uniref:DUF2892 domain-containing protein n=1 Tax=Sphingomonas sabuli TaxID=2764186 RepID=A0A7G9L4P0_9SPHN|nr:DUF2892 domain-containing protein [Sphingomonas sabuli]QNM83589.1 DUF2892 domain-containing protein [Sphingomonas sabuli]